MRIYIHDPERQNWNVFAVSNCPFCLFISTTYRDPARPRCLQRTARMYPRPACSLDVGAQAVACLTPLIFFLMISLLISSRGFFAEEAPRAETSWSRSYKTCFVPGEFSTSRCQEGTGAKQASRGNVWRDDSSVAAICSHQTCACAPGVC